MEAFDPGADRIDAPDDLVPWYDWQLRTRKLTVNNMQVGAADAARRNAHAHFSGAGLRIRPGYGHERGMRLIELHGAHGASS
jgi:hypothetical protein